MIDYRPFRNSDPPHLARIWNARPPLPLRLPDLTARLLDESALARLYFEPAGLLVAERAGRPVGFCHAGFAPAADGSALDPTRGCISALVIDSSEVGGDTATTVAGELLTRCTSYLAERGAQRCWAGGPGPLDPFYLGLYGGSRSDGVLADDSEVVTWFRAAGFEEIERRTVWQRALRGYRPPLDRTHMQWQRTATIERRGTTAAQTWWDACTLAQHEQFHFRLTLRPPARRTVELSFWDVQPLADSQGQRMAGFLGWSGDEACGSDGLLKFLLADALRRLLESGVTLVEAQLAANDSPCSALLPSLGFQPVAEKRILVRSL